MTIAGAVVGSNDSNMLTLKATFKESIDGLPKRGKMPPVAEVMTRTDVELVMTNNNMGLIGMLNGLRYDMDQMKATYDVKLQEKDTVIGQLNETIVKLSFALEKSQQYNNRDSFKICGIREPTGLGPNEREDTEKTVTTFFEKARIPVPKEELSITHRLPSRDTTRSKPLLVKLKSRILRNQVMRKKKELRDNAILKGDYPDAFIVEHLTPMRAKVAYKLRNDDTVERVWTIDGRLKVVLKGAPQPDKPITVDSLEQLIQIPGWTKDDIEKLVFEA